MSRLKQVGKNLLWDVGYYIFAFFIGFWVPRYIILGYGSDVNGLSSTINQIINLLLLLQSGTTTAAVFSLYKPIAEGDYQSISEKVQAVKNYYRNISLIFFVLMVIGGILTAEMVKSEIEKLHIFLAFFITGCKSFVDLLYTAKFRIVFTAFGDKYIISIATFIEQIVYYALLYTVIFLRLNFLFMYVTLFIGSCARIGYLQYKYTKAYANKILDVKGSKLSKIEGKNYALMNEIAHSIVAASPVIFLSYGYNLKVSSVYSIYVLPFTAISMILVAIYSSFGPSFGSAIIKKDKAVIADIFWIFQFIFLVLNGFFMLNLLFMINPFVSIYTRGETDINYINHILALLITLNGLFSAFRVPYNVAVSSFGLFKETYMQPVVCAILSLVLAAFLGGYDYSLVLLGPIIFYALNFVYQYFKIKELVPYLTNRRVYVLLVIILLGLTVTYFCSTAYFDANCGISRLLLAEAIYLPLSLIYLAACTYIFLRPDFMKSYRYFKSIKARLKHD